MLIDTASASLHLDPGRVTRIALGPRTRLTGVAGHAWITLDNDRRDIVLGPGDVFCAAGAGARALACALRGQAQAELLVTDAASRGACGCRAASP